MPIHKWVKLPSAWIEDNGLRNLRWSPGEGSANTASLMVLTAITHAAHEANGVAHLTYGQFENALGISRTKISAGLGVLKDLKVIDRDERRSMYQLTGFPKDNEGGWAKFPARRMYAPNGAIAAFKDFTLRKRTELEALKLFFLFVARRSNDTNMANLSYDSIQERSGVDQSRIKPALSLLATHEMVYTEQLPRMSGGLGISHGYRIVGIDPTIHGGTRNREGL